MSRKTPSVICETKLESKDEEFGMPLEICGGMQPVVVLGQLHQSLGLADSQGSN